MQANGARPGVKDWIVTMDRIVGQSGTIRLKIIGAKNGTPRAQLDAWAATSDDLVEFLQGAADNLAATQKRIVPPGPFRP